MTIKSYRDLEAYQHAKKLIPLIYELVETFPADERFDLCNTVAKQLNKLIQNWRKL